MRQDDALRKRFDQPDEPLVAGGGFHGHLKRPQLTEPVGNVVWLVAAERLPLGDDSPTTLLHHDAQADNLLMEVDADVLHGSAPFVETSDNDCRTPVRQLEPHRSTTYVKDIPTRRHLHSS